MSRIVIERWSFLKCLCSRTWPFWRKNRLHNTRSCAWELATTSLVYSTTNVLCRRIHSKKGWHIEQEMCSEFERNCCSYYQRACLSKKKGCVARNEENCVAYNLCVVKHIPSILSDASLSFWKAHPCFCLHGTFLSNSDTFFDRCTSNVNPPMSLTCLWSEMITRT